MHGKKFDMSMIDAKAFHDAAGPADIVKAPIQYATNMLGGDD